MDLINITIVLAAVGILAIAITIYRCSKKVVDRIRLRRASIAKIDTLEGYIHNDFIKVGKMYEKINKLDSRLGIVEVLAKDFNHNMDRYNENLNNDIAERLKAVKDRIVRLEKAKK